MSNTAPVEEMTREELEVCVTQLRASLAAARAVAADFAEQQLRIPALSDDGMEEMRELIQRDRMRMMMPPLPRTLTAEELRPYVGAADERYEVNLDIQWPVGGGAPIQAGDQNANEYMFDFNFDTPQGDPGPCGHAHCPCFPTTGCILLELPL